MFILFCGPSGEPSETRTYRNKIRGQRTILKYIITTGFVSQALKSPFTAIGPFPGGAYACVKSHPLVLHSSYIRIDVFAEGHNCCAKLSNSPQAWLRFEYQYYCPCLHKMKLHSEKKNINLCMG